MDKELLQPVTRWIKALLTRCFRVQVHGHYEPAINSVLIANRTSIIDFLLLSVFLPERLTIVLPYQLKASMHLKILKLFADVIEINYDSPSAIKSLINTINAGKRCVFFPEGLVEQKEKAFDCYEGSALLLLQARAKIIPVRIDGAQFSIFSLNKDKHLIRWFPKITLHVLPSVDYELLDCEEPGVCLFGLISEMHFSNSFKPKSLFSALLEGAALGIKHAATIEDSNRTPLTYKQFVDRCFILGRQIKKQTKVGEHVGVMMPTTTAGMVTFFALHAYRRIPAMLNFSMGFYNLFSACATAEIKTIYTSKLFIATAKLEALVEELQASGLTIRYLEDFKVSIKLGHKLSGLLKGRFAPFAYQLIGERVVPEQTALVLFTSGSEGAPKAVALSHSNILANCYQMMSRVDFTPNDLFFNALPIFHCFGLTAGSIIPLISGMKCFFYPSPLHYKIIPGLVFETKATIMFGTDTFLNGYARVAEKTDFKSIRYIFAGAEKVKPETRAYWADTFGVTLYEGYGATEASPVISLNCPLASIPGSVGMILPGMEYKIIPVDGIAVGGRLMLRGPNVMQGYISKDNQGIIEKMNEGWHDTGDIVTINASGFITIIGRAKRFAKIAGEMVSLTAVEGIAASIWPELLNAAVIKRIPGRGEKILLFSEAADADKTSFINKIRELGHSDLLIPYQVYPASTIPVLPSGKIDYVTLESLCSEVRESETVE